MTAPCRPVRVLLLLSLLGLAANAEAYQISLLEVTPAGGLDPVDEMPADFALGEPLWVELEVEGAATEDGLCLTFFDQRGTIREASFVAEPAAGDGTWRMRGPDTMGWRPGNYRLQAVSCRARRSGVEPVGPRLAQVEFRLQESSRDVPPPPGETADMPRFPWPPPRPFSHTGVPVRFFATGGTPPATFGEVAARLEDALDSRGYSERSFYQVDAGFTIVTRLEQIDEDGRPRRGPERWSAALPARRIFSLTDFVRSLFVAPEGQYRVVAFVVTSTPFSASGSTELSAEEAAAWLGTGWNALPAAVADLAWSDAHRVSALVYQFRREGAGTEPYAVDDLAPARYHLVQSGLWAALEER